MGIPGTYEREKAARMISHWQRTAALAFLGVLMLGTSPCEAMNIIWTNRNSSAFDSTERGVVDAAIDIWEYLIVDNGTSNNTFSVFINQGPIDGSGNTLGYATSPTVDGNGNPYFSVLRIDEADEGSFYDDPTPLDRSDDFPIQSATPYVYFSGASPAAGKVDLLSVVMHELGHALGFAAGYSRFNSKISTVEGVRRFDNLGMNLALQPDNSHVSTNHVPDLMQPSAGTANRKLPSTDDITALARAFDYILTSDLDRDGDVDTADLTKSLQNFTGDVGILGGKKHNLGDTDGDLDVDTADITRAFQSFTGDGSTGLASVPEPSSLVLCVLGLAGIGIFSLRRRVAG